MSKDEKYRMKETDVSAFQSHATLCATGKQRKENQDSVLTLSVHWNVLAVSILCISDGMGGLSEGKRASSLCVEGLAAWFHDMFSSDSRRILSDENLEKERNALFDAIFRVHESLNRTLHEEAAGKNLSMGATCTTLLIIGDAYAYVHIGDTRLYVKKKHLPLRQITHDDSLAYLDYQQGKIRKGAIRRHPKRNVLTRCMGNAPPAKLSSGRGRIAPDDVFFLCSDGVHGYCSDWSIGSAMNKTLKKGEEAGIHQLDRIILRSPAAYNYSMILATCRKKNPR